MFPASDPLLFIGSLLHSCVFPPSVLSNGDNKGDFRRIYLNNDISRRTRSRIVGYRRLPIVGQNLFSHEGLIQNYTHLCSK